MKTHLLKLYHVLTNARVFVFVILAFFYVFDTCVQVISPQRIPATVAPTLLLSPSVFAQTKSSSGLPAVAQDSCSVAKTLPRPPMQDEVRALSRSQLQAALLHLIQVNYCLNANLAFILFVFKLRPRRSHEH